MTTFNIKYEQAEAFKYLALEVKGAYSQIPDKITQLMQLTAEQNLFPSMRGPVFGIFYNDPREVANEDEYFWAVGYPCAETANFNAPLKLKERKESFVQVRIVAALQCAVKKMFSNNLVRINQFPAVFPGTNY